MSIFSHLGLWFCPPPPQNRKLSHQKKPVALFFFFRNYVLSSQNKKISQKSHWELRMISLLVNSNSFPVKQSKKKKGRSSKLLLYFWWRSLWNQAKTIVGDWALSLVNAWLFWLMFRWHIRVQYFLCRF